MVYGKSMLKNESRKLMKKWLNDSLSRPWTYWIAGVILGLINVLLFFVSGQALKLSTGIACGIGEAAQFVGADVEGWYFFQEGTSVLKSGGTLMDNVYTFLIVGIITGSAIGALASSQWRIRKFKKAHIIYALVGGILMGFGSRLAMGCNIGALFSAIPSFSLHGWVFGLSLFIGA